MNSKEEITEQENEESNSSKPIIKEEKKDEIDLSINMNAYGFTFMLLFVGVFGYLVISSFTSIPPFERDYVSGELLINDTILTLLIVVGLIFLGLGVYFGWIHKFPEKKTESEAVEAEETMVVYVDDSLQTEENENNNE